jgi:hypothetical protein
MKTLTKILLLFTIGLIIVQSAYSQRKDRDTVVVVTIENTIRDLEKKEYSFDIFLSRNSEMWHLWENATFQMEFLKANGTPIDYPAFDVGIDVSESEIISSSTYAPSYKVFAKILYDATKMEQNRVKFMVIGPEEPIFSTQFKDYSKLKLCRVTIRTTNNGVEIPASMEWKKPTEYYQATAFTFVDSVSTPPEYSIVHNENDHIEVAWTTEFVSPGNPNIDPGMTLSEFEVEYTGNLNAICRYSTNTEYNCAGYVIKRGAVNKMYTASEYESLPESIFDVTVGDYNDPVFYDRMKGQMASYLHRQYEPLPDTIDYRMVNYVYRLYYEKRDQKGLIKLATRNMLTPDGVITMATATPNPCSGSSTIEYIVEDDVYLTCEVFDQNGKSVKKLADNVNGLLDMTYVAPGKYYAFFEAPELASQGMYDIHFVAYPVNDKGVELSTANVKVQLIRGVESAK